MEATAADDERYEAAAAEWIKSTPWAQLLLHRLQSPEAKPEYAEHDNLKLVRQELHYLLAALAMWHVTMVRQSDSDVLRIYRLHSAFTRDKRLFLQALFHASRFEGVDRVTKDMVTYDNEMVEYFDHEAAHPISFDVKKKNKEVE